MNDALYHTVDLAVELLAKDKAGDLHILQHPTYRAILLRDLHIIDNENQHSALHLCHYCQTPYADTANNAYRVMISLDELSE